MRERYMITVKMTEYDIRGLFHERQNTPAHSFTDSHLYWMRVLAVAEIAERQPRIDKDSPVLQRDCTTEAAYPEGFDANYLERRAISIRHSGIGRSMRGSHSRALL